MRPFTQLALVAAAILAFVSSAAADSENRRNAQAAFDDWKAHIGQRDWKDTQARAEILANCGDEAVGLLKRSAKSDQIELSSASIRLLMKSFPAHEWTQETVRNYGLNSSEDGVRYASAFFLGEHRVYDSFRRLRDKMNDSAESDWVRYAAAKSLAELGEPDSIRVLYAGLGDDGYMMRYLSNRGIKALSGKDLNDFEYDYAEGAFVSGGVEAVLQFDAIRIAKLRAERFAAIERFCTWLKDARPDVYKHLTGGMFK